RNNPRKKLLNGQIWSVASVTRKAAGTLELEIDPDEADRTTARTKVITHTSFFQSAESEMSWQMRRQYDEFTYGDCLTVHKAQGSQWDDVYLFNESYVFREDAQRWVCTAVSRAAETITVVVEGSPQCARMPSRDPGNAFRGHDRHWARCGYQHLCQAGIHCRYPVCPIL